MSEKQQTAADPSKPSSEKVKKIAVVAVHGVGDHLPFATARDIGDLLSNLEYDKPSKTPRYVPFTEVTKRINVEPVKVDDKANGFNWNSPELQRNTWGPLDAVARAVLHGNGARHSNDADNPAESLDHLFMKGQLIEYKGERPEDTYQCLRLEGKRPAHSPAQDSAGEMGAELREEGVKLSAPDPKEKIVHIYEMYWADLSQLGNAFTRIFGELYQLLFHLGSVSVNNVLAAAINFPGEKKWQSFAQAQRFAAAVLAWPIPILNLLMAAVIPSILLVSLMRSHLSAYGDFLTLVALIALLCVAGSGYVLSKASRFPAGLFPVPLLLFGVLAIVVVAGGIQWNREATEEIFVAITLALSLGVVWLIVNAYEKRRPGSTSAALLIGAVFFATLIVGFGLGGFPIATRPSDYPALAVCLNIMEIAFGLLTLAWMIFYPVYIWAHFAGWRAVRAVRLKDPAKSIKASRTRWTAQLVLALCSTVFLSLTLAVWTGVIKIAIKTLPGQENAPACDAGSATKSTTFSHVAPGPDVPCQGKSCAPFTYEPVSSMVYRFIWTKGLKRLSFPGASELEKQAEDYAASPPLVSCWANQMLLVAGGAFLPLLLASFLIAFIGAAWALFPSIGAELNPPEYDPQKASENERQCAASKLEKQSISMGVWLDRGIRFTRWGGELLYWTMWLPPLLLVVLNFTLIKLIWVYSGTFNEFIEILGTVVAGAAIGMFGFAGRLKSFAGGFRPLLRVMLDVDNWLREHPRESNPTARICGRYVSLLRHISSWRDSAEDDQSGYDALVIIAHSQGTVITADFLRFLQVEKGTNQMAAYDPELGLLDKPVYLFTMGCPLHQLYALRFPFLYGWARNDTRVGDQPPGQVPDICPEDLPDPDALGVTRWTNAYRSGDYVGRHLWRGGQRGYEWTPASTSYEEEWDPPAGKPVNVSADQLGKRIEFCIGPGAHTHYWDHTAALIAEVLDRIVIGA